MLYEITSQDIKLEFYLPQGVFMGSSREEISVSEILALRGKLFKKPFVYRNLQPIVLIDTSSIYPYLDFRNETALCEEFFKKIEKEKVLENVSRMFDKLILEDKLLNGIDKTKLLNSISEMLNELSPEQMKIPEDELFERIRGVLALEAVSGILNELTPEEMKVFDEAVKRRPLFK